MAQLFPFGPNLMAYLFHWSHRRMNSIVFCSPFGFYCCSNSREMAEELFKKTGFVITLTLTVPVKYPVRFAKKWRK